MPPLPTIADVYRVTIPWSLNDGVAPRNVIHIHQASGSESLVAAAFWDGYQAAISTSNPWAPLSSVFECNALDILKLDGTSATQTISLPGTIGGSGSGQIIPASAAVMSFHTSQRGARGRGRQYVGPTTESNSTNGLLDSGVATEFVDAWGFFQSGLVGSATPATLVVASYVHADAHEVISFRADSVLGTQRRRQDQLR